MTSNTAYKYQVGGSLEQNAPSYVVRQADEDFYQALKAGEFCYVLNSRQMGKSSLRVQVMRRLQADGVACSVIDITTIGTHDITPGEWYLGIVRRLARSYGSRIKPLAWWNEREGLSPLQRLNEFIEQVLLSEVSAQIVIFIDEIDSILKLDFKDDFFALIRSCYNQRTENQQYQRLTFGLLGVATPSDLIQDKNRTPFNIGKAIDLKGFQPEETLPLARGLAEKVENPQQVITKILTWTGGQPFLTQKLCRLVATSVFSMTTGSEADLIEQVVRSLVIENWEAQDEPEHLKTIRDRILSNEQRSGRLLGIYQQVLQQGELVTDDSPEQIELRLSGLVVDHQGKLKVYNRIYELVFDLSWTSKALAKLRPYSTAIEAWVASNKDESWLLAGQTLLDAQIWADNKSLSDLDYQFLAASQKLSKREVEIALDTERQTKQRLAEAQHKAELALEEERQANQRLAKAQKKTKWQMAIGAAVLGLSLVGAVLVLGHANENLKSAISARDAANQKRDSAISAQNVAQQRVKATAEQERALTNQAENAKKEQQKAELERKKAEQNIRRVNQNLAKTKVELQAFSLKTQQAYQQLNQADGRLKIAQREAQQAKRVQQDAENKAKSSEQRAVQAEHNTQQANLNLTKAKADLEVARKTVEGVNAVLAEIQGKFGNLIGKARTLTNIGEAYSSIGEPQKALEYFNQALPIFKQASGSLAGEGATLSNIGKIYSYIGEPQKALNYYNQALPIHRKQGDRAGEATTLDNIGAVYQSLGDRQKALAYYNQALPLRRAMGDRAGEATTLDNIGTVYQSLGEIQKALHYYHQTLPLRRAVSDRLGEATTLDNIGSVYQSLGDRQKALTYYHQALPLRRSVGDRAGEATTLDNIGSVYQSLGDRQKALTTA